MLRSIYIGASIYISAAIYKNTHLFVVYALLEQRRVGFDVRQQAAVSFRLGHYLQRLQRCCVSICTVVRVKQVPSVFVLGIICSVCSAAASVFVLLYE